MGWLPLFVKVNVSVKVDTMKCLKGGVAVLQLFVLAEVVVTYGLLIRLAGHSLWSGSMVQGS